MLVANQELRVESSESKKENYWLKVLKREISSEEKCIRVINFLGTKSGCDSWLENF